MVLGRMPGSEGNAQPAGWRNWRAPGGIHTVRYSEKILEANSITVETLDLSEVIGRIGRMKDTDERAVQN